MRNIISSQVIAINTLYCFDFLFFQHVCRVCMERAACSTAAVLRARPATTSLETAAVLLDSRETAVSRVSAAGPTSASSPGFIHSFLH